MIFAINKSESNYSEERKSSFDYYTLHRVRRSVRCKVRVKVRVRVNDNKYIVSKCRKNITQQNVNDPSNKHFIVDLNNEKTVGLQNSKNLLHTQKKSLVTELIYNYLLNDVFDLLQYNNLEISDLQQKNLDELFKYLEHFNKEFTKTNAHDNTCLKEKAKNLGSFYINQRNVIIGNDIFRKVIKNKMDCQKKLTEAQQKNDANLSNCITFRMNEMNDTIENIKFQLKELRVMFEDSVKEGLEYRHL
ncbi:hypothetical protein C2G38_2168593 [Gigaspora rosea]|uniref:Uncharacterized protein n=1 Tax=Gigaspora rosea TaxID=44941 RepID=A0A397VPP0_9GLOM|nr:hypothetical protein C2G38_2168593 [Gigaspora rosea]